MRCCFNLWKFFDQPVIIQFKSHAVMDVSGCHFYVQNIPVFVARCVRFIRKLLFVFAFVENAAVRIRCGFIYNFGLRRFVIIIRKRLLSVLLSILVDLLRELLLVLFSSDRYLLFNVLFHVCACLDVRAVDENGFRRKHIACSNFIEDPVENILDRLLREAMLEIVADRRKMGDFSAIV